MVAIRCTALMCALALLTLPTDSAIAQDAPPAPAEATTAGSGADTPPTEQNSAAEESAASDKTATPSQAAPEKPPTPPAMVEELPFNIRPYEVLVTTGVGPGCLTDTRLRADLLRDIDRAIQRM